MKTFRDRSDAGRQLANKLTSYTNSDAVVLALPRGGVVVGHEIATRLHVPLDVIITRKIGHPQNKEYAICAITEDGRRICDSTGLRGIDEAWVQQESAIAMGEVVRRRQLLSGGEAIPITDKTVIVVDDGVATGLTMRAALMMVHAQKPARVILAVPVVPHDVLKDFQDLADEFVILDNGKDFRGSVGEYYENFAQVPDKEIVLCLKSTRKSSKKLLVPTHN